MENLEKVELIREKCNVSYEEAAEALEACEYDVLDAIVMLERAGKRTERIPQPDQEPVYETETADSEPTASETPKAKNVWRRFCTRCKELAHAGMDSTFVAERNGERLLAIPVLIVVVGPLMWGASLWLLVIGLFFGLRYHIEGTSQVAATVNDAMDKVADAAESIKESVA